MPTNPFRNLPSVNQLLESPQLKSLVENANHSVVVSGVRTFMDRLRDQVATATGDVSIPTAQELAEKIAHWITREDQPHLRPVINATGVILHTGLGRAPLAQQAVDEMCLMATDYASVEINLQDGKRSQRDLAVKRLLCEITGAESATVVNNNAAATMLALSAMAEGKEVIVSRGQLVEIGGSYRLPDVMECSRAKLREVGTTNKTRLSDYENAINENTGAILRVHPSNFRVVGFTQSVDLPDLVALAKKHKLPVIDDVGSGALVDFNQFGLTDEPLVRECVEQGADVVLFSGDKLVGGPQCGIVAGTDYWVEKIKKHPMTRAMRVDKLTLSALAATLRIYRDPAEANAKIPLLRMLSTSEENLKLRAERMASQISQASWVQSAEPVQDTSTMGGGTLPAQYLPTWCVAIRPEGITVNELAGKLRTGKTAIFGRINNEQLLLDLRTVDPKFDVTIVEIIGDSKTFQ